MNKVEVVERTHKYWKCPNCFKECQTNNVIIGKGKDFCDYCGCIVEFNTPHPFSV
jgi:hypothetical protein